MIFCIHLIKNFSFFPIPKVGSCSLPLNPSTSEPPAMASAVSISSETFSPSQGPNVKSYMLMLRVTVTRNSGSTSNGIASTSEITNGDCDGKFSSFLFILFNNLCTGTKNKFHKRDLNTM